MPVYEYRCNKCKRLTTVYARGFSETPEVTCANCGGKDLTRLFSSFTLRKTWRDFYDDILTDKELADGMMANDPRALAKWSRKMDAAAGGEMDSEHEDLLQRLEGGESWQKLVTEYQQKELGTPAEPESSSKESPEET